MLKGIAYTCNHNQQAGGAAYFVANRWLMLTERTTVAVILHFS